MKKFISNCDNMIIKPINTHFYFFRNKFAIYQCSAKPSACMFKLYFIIKPERKYRGVKALIYFMYSQIYFNPRCPIWSLSTEGMTYDHRSRRKPIAAGCGYWNPKIKLNSLWFQNISESINDMLSVYNI